eukprot:UN14113
MTHGISLINLWVIHNLQVTRSNDYKGAEWRDALHRRRNGHITD